MSLFKFGNFEAEVDFTDLDFLERLEYAKQRLNETEKKVPKTGSVKEIIMGELEASDIFFDTLFGDGAGYEIRGGRNSVKVCIEAMQALNEAEDSDSMFINQTRDKYSVQNRGNRQQRRQHEKNSKKNYPRKQG